MALKTVSVPESMIPAFEQAEAVVSAYFRKRRDDPEQGTIEIFDERYVLVRAGAMSVEFFEVVRDLLGPQRQQEADEFARNLLFDLAHAVGRSDARNFHSKMGLEDPIERLSAGPVHFSHTGWAFVDISAESTPGDKDSYHLVYEHPYSFESDAWLAAGELSTFPVCVMNAGYSSGWCEESFKIRLVASEVMCRARGDDCCRFLMAHPERIEAQLAKYAVQEGLDALQLRQARIPDLFARKRLEEALRSAREDLEKRVTERTEELREAKEALEAQIKEREAVQEMLLQSQKMEALGLLAGGIAHDFNNLLTAIGGYGEMVLDHLELDSPVAKAALEIVKAADRASALTRQLLVFSRKRVQSEQVLDVNVTLKGLKTLLRPMLGGHIELILTPASSPCCVRADPIQLEQVLMNMALNARDAMRDGGRLEIAAVRAERFGSEHVRIKIRDTGVGMSKQTLTQIFDPFFTTKRAGVGTGLGLATAQMIINKADGEIEVQSALGEGTCMTIWLPTVDVRLLSPQPPPVPEASFQASHHLLIVEDDERVRELFSGVLKQRGHRVVVAAGANEAMRQLRDHIDEIEAVICDVIMPDLSGPELVQKMRAVRPDLPVIFMSGYTDDRLTDFDFSGAATSFLHKPFRLAVLEDAIARLLESGQ